MSIITLVLTVLLFVTISLQRTYTRYPLKELKRRARDGDEIAAELVRASAYGNSLKATLWVITLLLSSLLFLNLSTSGPAWFAITAIAIFIFLGYVWLPATRISSISEKFAAYLARFFELSLRYLDPFLSFLDRKTLFFRSRLKPTGMYDTEDFLELIERQQLTPGNRIPKLELGIAAHALQFESKLIIDHMTPRRAVKLVSARDSIGPVILDELHASGHSRFPVYGNTKDEIVGTLYLHDLVKIKGDTTVRDEMRKKVYYLHEDQNLHDALQAVLKTHHHMFVVVNSFEEFVGVISSEDVFEALMGKPIMDEFDKYEDLRSVAERAARIDHKKHD
jgi:putative hemolysin